MKWGRQARRVTVQIYKNGRRNLEDCTNLQTWAKHSNEKYIIYRFLVKRFPMYSGKNSYKDLSINAAVSFWIRLNIFGQTWNLDKRQSTDSPL